MQESPGQEAHGAFAFTFEDDYTLISASGSWNMPCADIYYAVIRKRVELKPDLKRCIVIDAREWGFETPDSGRKIQEMSQYISGYYKDLFIAYVLSPDNRHLAKYILDKNITEYSDVITWRFYQDFQSAVSWLRSEGFKLPDLEASDFPKPVPAGEYLKNLS